MRSKSLRNRTPGRARRRFRPLLIVSLLTVGLSLVAFNWSWIDAHARAAVVISTALEAPVVTSAVEAATGEPRLTDVSVAGNPTLIAHPNGEGPWPALFFVNGFVSEGRELPQVRRLAEGLARAGYLVVVPDLPGLRRGEISPKAADETVQVALSVAERPDAQGGRVGLIGASAGATLALLAAEDPSLRDRVTVVADVAPYADIKTVVNLATTGHYSKDGEPVPYKVDPFLSNYILRSLIATLPDKKDRDVLLAELGKADWSDPEPLAGFCGDGRCDPCPCAESVADLLSNRDPERFEELYAALPDDMLSDLEKISPLAGDGRLEAPIELISSPQDKYFPISESYAVAKIAPHHRVTATEALDHAELNLKLENALAFADVHGFVVRSLRQAKR